MQVAEFATSREKLTGSDALGLREYLRHVWQSRRIFDDEDPLLAYDDNGDPLLGFTLDRCIKARNYVGFVQWGKLRIEVYPKIFGSPPTPDRYFRHLLWWLSYCRRVRFPFSNLLADEQHITDFPEALITYFARFANQVVSSQPYSRYQEQTEAMTFLRGRLNTAEYVRQSLANGSAHQLVCDYEPFVYNNRLNQIIKYVARQLSQRSKFPETYHALGQVLFILDEVDDVPCTRSHCDGLVLNRFFEDYEVILDMCRFFLSESYLDLSHPDLQQFCFLVPMEYVFEDFLHGFIEQELGDLYEVEYQARGWLTDQKSFQIRNDLILKVKTTGKRLIIDTKYKPRYEYEEERKAGIAQSDMYQMVSYALRRNCDHCLLLYPQRDDAASTGLNHFTVSSEMMPKRRINLWAANISITSRTTDFKQTTNQLKADLTHLITSLMSA